ncbi:Plasmodium exported protein, unknown function [Plasmodium relictum]|uniref:Uncharacterized protein n=1 Tax=Plasmodium relictum TaxID=85471 RepID=A0A1J1GMW5_PLARL|nr:Plasmodium exported protein, unknown function [Plasmodium relictum]CRG84624.1 Plasmodium exported protein, unknown function [Plasmodium relictum]
MVYSNNSSTVSLRKFLIAIISTNIKKFYRYSSSNNNKAFERKKQIKCRMFVLLILYFFSLSIIFKDIPTQYTVIWRLCSNKNHIRKLAEDKKEKCCGQTENKNVHSSCFSCFQKKLDNINKMRKWSKVKKRALKWIKDSYEKEWTEEERFRYILQWNRNEKAMLDLIKNLNIKKQNKIKKDLADMRCKWEERLEHKTNKN